MTSWGSVIVIGLFLAGAVAAAALSQHDLAVSLAAAAGALALPHTPRPPGSSVAGEDLVATAKRAVPALAVLAGYGAVRVLTEHAPQLALYIGR